jgi:hypothetical protein
MLFTGEYGYGALDRWNATLLNGMDISFGEVDGRPTPVEYRRYLDLMAAAS